jgi:pectate lyase
MKLVLTPAHIPYIQFATDDNIILRFNSTNIWFDSIRFDDGIERNILSFLNDELKLNGIVIKRNYTNFLTASKEVMFRLQLSVVEYRVFEFK